MYACFMLKPTIAWIECKHKPVLFEETYYSNSDCVSLYRVGRHWNIKVHFLE